MISIKKSSSYRRDCEIYEKYINFLHGADQKAFEEMYKTFKNLVDEFDKQALSLDSHSMTYNTHTQLKDRLNAHKKKMDDQVKTEKHIARLIQSRSMS